MISNNTPGRGLGRTTEQMKAAPRDAVYVWLNGPTYYPRKLAQSLGRGDLRICTPSQIKEACAGLKVAVVVDHAAELTMREWCAVTFQNDHYRRGLPV